MIPTDALARARQFVRGSLDRWAEEPGLLAAGERDAYQMALNVIEGREPLDNRPIEQAAEAADRETRCARCGLTRRFLYGDRLVEHDFHFGTNLNDGHAFIEQAAEAVDREDTESDAGSDATPSAAVAPLDVEALREQVYYLLFIYGQMDAEHGHWAAVRRMLNIDAAYADAIRKRGGA